MARHFVDSGILPDLVLCSPARRTRETLDGIAQALSDTVVEVEEELYGASALALLDRIQRLPPTTDSVLVIGHNPGFEELAELLLGPAGHDPTVLRMREKYPTGAVASFQAPSEWTEVGPGSCTLRCFVRPRDMR
jgi:phosphohistidine phosphatase